MFFITYFHVILVDDIQTLAKIIIVNHMCTYLISGVVLSREVATTITP